MDILQYAKEQYEKLNVDIEQALVKLASVPISLHCWQGDDVGGFETPDAELAGGGIQVTGNHPGKARTIEELQKDLEKVYSLLPGSHRLNLHASYGNFGGKSVDRDQIETSHYTGWIDWAKENNLKLDFNATLFSHPKAESGFTLSHQDKEIRDFWIEHTKRSRQIAEEFGKQLGSPAIHNTWIPDGSKDYTVDRMGYRTRLTDSLDKIFSEKLDETKMKDAVESKLFGIGSEAFTVGSHEYYMGYALSRDKMICLDLGHFHPTESIADKISSVFQFQDELLLHVSRPMRWDSDHIVVLNDDIWFLMQELVRSGNLDSTHIGLDFFDATLNRIGAWTIGTRAALKGLLAALLEPTDQLLKYEREGNNFARLALLEQLKTMPYGIIWDHYCNMNNVPTDAEIIGEILEYEHNELAKRN